jgi:hypothetical protein
MVGDCDSAARAADEAEPDESAAQHPGIGSRASSARSVWIIGLRQR